jgi:hypothetical protein
MNTQQRIWLKLLSGEYLTWFDCVALWNYSRLASAVDRLRKKKVVVNMTPIGKTRYALYGIAKAERSKHMSLYRELKALEKIAT